MKILNVLAVLGSLLAAPLGIGCTKTGPGGGTDGGPVDLALARDLGRSPVDGSMVPDLANRRNSGDCDSSLDCPMGTCVELSPGGYRVCSAPVAPVSSCAPRGPLDECCKNADCPGPADQCHQWPLSPYCGGPPPLLHNVCTSDACQANADCPGLAVCVPPGAFGNKVRQCLTVGCLRDSDCTAERDGRCLPIKDPCCAAIRGLFCVYPSGCHTSADCPGGYCEPAGTRTQCHPGSPPCPI